MAKKKKKALKKKGKKLSFKARISFIFILICAAVFAPSTVLFLVLMLPSIVASMFDHQIPKTRGVTVGAMNFAGFLPAWMTMLANGHTMQGAIESLTDPMIYVLAYGLAMGGWFIEMVFTPFVAKIIVFRYQKGLKSIKKEQRYLIDIWGKEVYGSVPYRD